MEIGEILRSDDGPEKTAALVTWVQSQARPDETAPILVGGAAVELYTSGAYTTGDLDSVGTVTPSLEGALRAAGFERLDLRRLEDRVHEAGWHAAFEALKELGERWTDTDPSEEELAAWATAGPLRR